MEFMSELDKKFEIAWKEKFGKSEDLKEKVGKNHFMRLRLLGYIVEVEDNWKLTDFGKQQLSYKFSTVQKTKNVLKSLWKKLISKL